MIVFLALGLALATTAHQPDAPRHDFHLSYTRIAVEGGMIGAGVRFFKDDLEDALALFAGDPAFRLAVDARSDSLVTAYVDSCLDIRRGDSRLRGTIVSSGEDVEGSETVWWYAFEFTGGDVKTSELSVSNRLLFEVFDDQKNIVKLQHFPSGEQATYYLTQGDESLSFSW